MIIEKDVDLVVLGGGPVSLFIDEIARKYNKSTLIILPHRFLEKGMLNTIRINKQIVNYIPVYPVKSELLHINDDAPILTTDYGSLIKNTYSVPSFKKNSYTDYLTYKKQEDLFIMYSEKVFGNLIHKFKLNNAQKKLNAHYLIGTPSIRVGFIDGKSYYHDKIQSLLLKSNTINPIIERIDRNRKIIFLSNNVQLKYKKLISTISPRKLYSLTHDIIESEYVNAPAKFAIFEAIGGLKENQIKYDPNPKSPIYRAVSINRKLISVQISLNAILNSELIKNYLSQLIKHQKKYLVFHKFYTHRLAYPLDILKSKHHYKLKSELEEDGIILFGRFGEWKYQDLHELNWETLNEKIQHI